MKVTFFDTESTALDGSWGRILCASFVGLEGETRTFRKDVKPFIGRNKVDDSRLVIACKRELESSDMIVGWNSILHDIPLLNARLRKAGADPIRVGEKHGVLHLDMMYYAGGSSMKIGSRRLDNVAKFFEQDLEKTSLDGEIWQLAAAGETDAMDEVVEHCEIDTELLRELFPILAVNVKKFQFNLSEVYPWIDQIPSRR